MNKRSLIRSLVTGALLLFTRAACAETVNTTADLSKSNKTVAYSYSYPMMESLYRLAVEQDKRFGLQQDCKSEYKVEPFSMSVVQPIDFPDDKQHPVKGMWMIRYQIHRCGQSKFYNALFIASANGKTPPTTQAYYPGNSNADPLLIKDAMMSAWISASVKSGVKECKEIEVFDMRVTEKAHDVAEEGKTFKGVWKETWTFRACGKIVDVEITFIPDATGGGTSFVIGPINSGKADGKK